MGAYTLSLPISRTPPSLPRLAAARTPTKKLVDGGARFYLSGGSCVARGVAADDLQGLSVEMAGPPALVRLVMECDRTIVY